MYLHLKRNERMKRKKQGERQTESAKKKENRIQRFPLIDMIC